MVKVAVIGCGLMGIKIAGVLFVKCQIVANNCNFKQDIFKRVKMCRFYSCCD